MHDEATQILQDDSGKVLLHHGILVDVTEMKRMQDELRTQWDQLQAVTAQRQHLLSRLLRRKAEILELPVQSNWWGYYEVSPDHNAIVGEAPGIGRFLYATGFSGHGFQQSPAIGEHMAQLVRGEQPTFDLSGFANNNCPSRTFGSVVR